MKNEYVVKIREAGSKRGKSLYALVPAAVAKEFGLSPTTILLLRLDKHRGDLIFRRIYDVTTSKVSKQESSETQEVQNP